MIQASEAGQERRVSPLKTLSGGECATNSVSMASNVPGLGDSSGPNGVNVGFFSFTLLCCRRHKSKLSVLRHNIQNGTCMLAHAAAQLSAGKCLLKGRLHASLHRCIDAYLQRKGVAKASERIEADDRGRRRCLSCRCRIHGSHLRITHISCSRDCYAMAVDIFIHNLHIFHDVCSGTQLSGSLEARVKPAL